MAGSTFGHTFRLTGFGESHGPAIGGIVEGCPAGMVVDLEAVQRELDRRRPGGNPLGTARDEADTVEWLSGLMEGRTLGTPIGFLIRNRDARSKDYAPMKDMFRPGHADKVWEQKYGLRDHRGGGRSSARETAVRVAAGALARQLLATAGMEVHAWVSRVGDVVLETAPVHLDLSATWSNPVRCPDAGTARSMTELIEQMREEGDTVGGVITCLVKGAPAGLGEPVFDKLHADLGKAMLSINAAKGFQLAGGFASAAMRGSEHNRSFVAGGGGGGVQGGISNGGDIRFEVAFRPVSTLMRPQEALDREGNTVQLEATGRHDPCVLPRAVPIVEAMACLVMADHLLRQRSARL